MSNIVDKPMYILLQFLLSCPFSVNQWCSYSFVGLSLRVRVRGMVTMVLAQKSWQQNIWPGIVTGYRSQTAP